MVDHYIRAISLLFSFRVCRERVHLWFIHHKHEQPSPEQALLWARQVAKGRWFSCWPVSHHFLASLILFHILVFMTHAKNNSLFHSILFFFALLHMIPLAFLNSLSTINYNYDLLRRNGISLPYINLSFLEKIISINFYIHILNSQGCTTSTAGISSTGIWSQAMVWNVHLQYCIAITFCQSKFCKIHKVYESENYFNQVLNR